MFVRFAHDAGKNMLLRYNLRYLGIIPSLFEAGTDLRSVRRVNWVVAQYLYLRRDAERRRRGSSQSVEPVSSIQYRERSEQTSRTK